MFKRRNVLLFLAGVAIFLASAVCGGSSMAPGAPAPTADLSQPSGGGSAPEVTPYWTLPLAGGPADVPTAAALDETPVVIILQPTATAIAKPGEGVPVAAIPESRRLTLEYPPSIRTGDSDIVRLTLEVDTLGNLAPTAEVQGNVVTGQTVAIPNVYDTHIVLAVARLDLAGVDIRPSENVSEPLLPGEKVTFFWSVHPTSSGTYRGTAWLRLHFIDKTTKEESEKALSAQTVQITATDLLGLNGNLARTAGGVGSVVGAVLGFPFVDEVLKWLWKRLRGKG